MGGSSQDWLDGYTFTQIKQRRWHSIGAIERYCMTFQQVIRLQYHGLDEGEIRRSTGMSERLIQEYLDLAEKAGTDNEQLQRISTTPNDSTQAPAVIKRGDWLT